MILQEKLQELMKKEDKFEKLIEDAVEKAMSKQLHDSWMVLHDTVVTLIQERHESFKHCDTYHQQTAELSARFDAAAAAVDDVERNRDAELSHRLSQMEVI